MKDWFDNLEAREQIFVVTGAVIVVVALIYALFWLPLDKSHRQAQQSVADWEQSLAELGPLRALVANAGGEASPQGLVDTGQAPIIIVDQTLRSRALEQYRRRSQPTTSNGIRVELESVPFDELVLWLGDLSEQYGLHVQAGSLSAIAQAGPGRVNASLTLERSL
jgi:general secretion pathway protein M